jgi:hypothetical protein
MECQWGVDDMRDPTRIDQILHLLQEVWIRSPDLRLGQLIVKAVQPRDPCPEIFAVEDTVLARQLERLLKQPRNFRQEVAHEPQVPGEEDTVVRE